MSRSAGRPTITPIAAVSITAPMTESGAGIPSRSVRIADVKAPTARNPPWPREICPVYPTRMLRPIAPIAAIRAVFASDIQ